MASKSILERVLNEGRAGRLGLPVICRVLKSNCFGTGTLAMGRVTCKEQLGLWQVTLEKSLLLGKETVSARPRYVKFEAFSLGKLELSSTNDSPSVGPDCQGFFAFRSLTHLS